jgi:SPP1 family phage portal protein
LSGKHKILNRQVEYYNGREFYPRTIVLQYAKTLINFSTSYLLKNPVTLTGEENTVKEFKRVYKQGKYNRIDFDILDKMVKYGTVYEYVYLDSEVIKSKLIASEDSYPVYNEQNKMISFIEHWTTDDNISYYVVYYPDKVEKWNNAGGDLNFEGSYSNLSGLPIVYKTQNELDNSDGRSDLEDWINLIDNLEDLISKYTDSLYKFINPIPVVIGQKLAVGKNGEGAVSQHVVGNGLNLDDGSDMKFVSGQMDYKSFELIFKTLKQALLDISCTPAVSMNNTDISNLSEVSIKLLFALSDIKASLNERHIREGMEQRFYIIAKLLKLKGIEVNADDVDVKFEYSRPMNESDVINNLRTLAEMNSISLQTILENSPYVYDVGQELERLKTGKVVDEKVNS